MNLELFFNDLKNFTTNKKIADFVNNDSFIFSNEQILQEDIKLKNSNFLQLDAYNLVIVNGFLSKDLSSFDLPIKIQNLQENNYNKEIINITKTPDKPIQLIFISFNNEKQKLVILPNIEINIDDNVTVDFVIDNLNITDGQYFENKNIHINIGKNSDVNIYNYYDEKIVSCVFDNNYIKLNDNSNINIISITNTKNILTKKTVFDIAKNCTVSFNSSFFVENTADVSDDILLNHFENTGTSTINSYGVAFDNSNIYFKTNVVCPKNTENITTSQISKILLGDNTATGKIEPYQTIATEKVSAFHGATISGISNEELFFLETRGIDKITAKKMIYNIYLQTPLAFIKNKNVHKSFYDKSEHFLD